MILNLELTNSGIRYAAGQMASGEHFEILPQMVKCTLSPCHSHADVERSFSGNNGMLTKQNVFLSEETFIGLRTTKAAVEECGAVNKVPITLYLMKVANNSYRMYMEHLRQENAKERPERI